MQNLPEQKLMYVYHRYDIFLRINVPNKIVLDTYNVIINLQPKPRVKYMEKFFRKFIFFSRKIFQEENITFSCKDSRSLLIICCCGCDDIVSSSSILQPILYPDGCFCCIIYGICEWPIFCCCCCC